MNISINYSKNIFAKVFLVFQLFAVLLSLNGCASSTTFRVLDAESKEPVEGAVGIAMWSSSRGLPGLASSYTKKAIEGVSDAQGYLTFPEVSGSYTRFTPRVKIYRPGYVGWDSRYIYLGHHPNDKMRPYTKRRENFVMKNQDILLEHWRDEYTFISHESFLDVPGDLIDLNTSKYLREIHVYEDPRSNKERNVFFKKR